MRNIKKYEQQENMINILSKIFVRALIWFPLHSYHAICLDFLHILMRDASRSPNVHHPLSTGQASCLLLQQAAERVMDFVKTWPLQHAPSHRHVF